MMGNTQQDGEAGFSVIEILFAFLILSMLLVATIQLIVGSMKFMQRADLYRDEATVIEDIRTGPLQEILKNVAVTGTAENRVQDSWRILVSPVKKGTEGPRSFSTYGRLVHIQIYKLNSAEGSEQRTLYNAYETFQLVPKP